ncbi:Rho termination factor N-terminal domain-containing protein [Mesomycoplasma ovipneumoniae]|uniref:Rho termination factor N-terminal domain-containing protein n=1 Tax=Mesomycoplasma ovipneumoniae TaxID=29562 RepID=UPI0029642BB4|nr:Rho termination factor N-terminal domain-containing protein [Mesomycoplasma ovipneumoniae]MDW2920929.1 Rho termination factor N-terminal domain-containing protein [Mesomycoplasma ovipneumoniae]
MVWENPFGKNKVPSVAELWKNEKKQYRIWIFSYPLLLLLLGVFLSVQLFLDLDIRNIGRAFSILSILFTVTSLFFYVYSVFTSYKAKDFAPLGDRSFFFTFVSFSTAALSIINSTIVMIGNLSLNNQNFVAILTIQIILIGLIFVLIPFFLTKVLKIKSIFKLSRTLFIIEKRIDEMKKDPKAYSEFMNIFDLGHQNPMNAQQANNPENTQTQEAQNKPKTKEERIKIALEKLNLTQLHEIAQKLEISGFEQLKKQELIKLLTLILAQQDSGK